MSEKKHLSRRSFVKRSLQTAAGILLAGRFIDPIESLASSSVDRPMSFFHTHTGERLTINYSSNGCSAATLAELNHFLRDFRTGEVHPIDPALLDIIYGIQQKSGSSSEIETISGYRSPETNNLLRLRNRVVSKKSLHMKGQALDLRLSDLRTRDLRDAAISLHQGGVGYYPKSRFVHVDTGRYRIW